MFALSFWLYLQTFYKNNYISTMDNKELKVIADAMLEKKGQDGIT